MSYGYYVDVEHPMKHLVTKDDLTAGTGYQITQEEYEEFFNWEKENAPK